jgi:hypothetical protein
MEDSANGIKEHGKYIQGEKTKPISPSLESFHRDFKIFCMCIQFNFRKLQLSSENLKRFP